MRKILTVSLLLIASYFIVKYGIDLYNIYFAPKALVMAPPPPPMIGMEAGPVKVNISEDTPWESIAKLVSTVLITYLGIKLINKYVR
jgi:hypothetical protein